MTNEGAPSPRSRHTALWTGAEMIVWGGTGPDGSEGLGDGGRYDPATDSWRPISTTNAPSPRFGHRAIWTGSEMIVWGGRGPANSSIVNYLDGGARYVPATDSWVPLPPAPVQGRGSFSAVWTGEEFIVWGGAGVEGRQAVALGDGARYASALDQWLPLSTIGAPVARWDPYAVWTGEEMIVWGGAHPREGVLSDGARYVPSIHAWSPVAAAITSSGVLTGANRTAVWTGSEMLLWGGPTGRDEVGNGARYELARDEWTAISTDGAPSARSQHTGVWTDRELIIWGGMHRRPPRATLASTLRTDAGRYDPATDTWTPVVSDAQAPSPRVRHTAVWTGSEMIVWGGVEDSGYVNDGARYRASC
jgi:N-acetylneuraminic acid mutarotase